VIADHRKTKGHQPSGAITTKNSCPKVIEAVSSRVEAKKCDVKPARAMQRKLGVAQSLRKASVADAEGHMADTGHPRAE